MDWTAAQEVAKAELARRFGNVRFDSHRENGSAGDEVGRQLLMAGTKQNATGLLAIQSLDEDESAGACQHTRNVRSIAHFGKPSIVTLVAQLVGENRLASGERC